MLFTLITSKGCVTVVAIAPALAAENVWMAVDDKKEGAELEDVIWALKVPSGTRRPFAKKIETYNYDA